MYIATEQIASQGSEHEGRERGSFLHDNAEGAIGSVIRLRLRSVLAYLTQGFRLLP